MKIIFIFVYLFLSTIGFCQVVEFELPKYYVEEVNEVRTVIEFDQSKEKFRITEYTVNMLNYNLQKMVYQGSLDDLDLIVLKGDKQVNRIRINFSTCENEENISIKNYSYNMCYIDGMSSYISLSGWDFFLHKEELSEIVNELNEIIKGVNQDEYCLSIKKTFDTHKSLSSNGIYFHEDRIIYRKIDSIPSFRDSYSIESMQDEIQNYIFECVLEESYNSSTVALVNFLITKSGEVEDISIQVITEDKDKEFIIRCFEKMPKWKPGSNDLGLQIVKVATIVGLDLGDMDLKVETLLKIDTIYHNHNTFKIPNRVDSLDGVYYVFEELAHFENGELAYELYLDSLRDEIIEIHNRISGILIFSFVVEKNGSISELKIIETPTLKAASYLRERLKSMPKWIPSRYKGKIVRQYRTGFISFRD